MHLGSIYLVVKEFEKSLEFYEKLLEMPVSKMNMNRFAMFNFEGNCIALMNGLFDSHHPDKVERKGEFNEYFDDLKQIANLPNSRKAVLNFWDEDLKEEYRRIKELNISDKLTSIKYICNVSPYYYFQLTDPDGNIIEVTGEYVPDEGEFNEVSQTKPH
jgi:lactoylglutathione lyase